MHYVLLVLLALLAMALGFWANQAHGACVASPIQTARLGSVDLTGAIADIETRPYGLRLSLRHGEIAKRPDWRAPRVISLILCCKQ
ncbi:MAG: hypothetical protein CMM23_02445 [Rhodospirillaceae bacterium]|nr:hypothetical protein [Rhodospirillaceae bacterium]